MKRAFVLLLLSAAVVGSSTGCGSSNSTPSHTTDTSAAAVAYVTQMRNIAVGLAKFNRFIQARDTAVANGLVVRDLTKDAALYQAAIVKLQKIHPPAAVADSHQKLIDGIKLYRTELLSAAKKIKGGDRAPLTALNNAQGISVMNLASLAIVSKGYNILSIDANANP